MQPSETNPTLISGNKPAAFKKLYSYTTEIKDAISMLGSTFIIRNDFEEQDLTALPVGIYWWQNADGKVEKFEKK